MDTYSVGDIATALNVSVSTVRNWTENKEIEAYLSNMATRKAEYENATERRYTQNDLFVLNTVSSNKNRRTDWEDIAAILARGDLDRDLPETAMLVMSPTSSESFYTLARAQERIQMLERRIKELEDELKVERAKDDRSDLYGQIGVLKFILKQHGINPETGKQDTDT